MIFNLLWYIPDLWLELFLSAHLFKIHLSSILRAAIKHSWVLHLHGLDCLSYAFFFLISLFLCSKTQLHEAYYICPIQLIFYILKHNLLLLIWFPMDFLRYAVLKDSMKIKMSIACTHTWWNTPGSFKTNLSLWQERTISSKEGR